MQPTERDRFEATGLIKLPNLLPDELTGRALARVHEQLEQAGLRKEGDWRLERLGDEPVSRRNKKFLKQLKNARVFADLVTPDLIAAVQEAAGGAVTPMMERPQLLFSLPRPGAWSVPHNVWHVDLPKLPNRRRVPGVQAFAMLDTVGPEGGGTVVVEGGHHLLLDIPFLGSRQVKYRLRREPYFRELMSKKTPDRGRFLHESVPVGPTRLRVVELTGRRGDVYLVDMRLLHAPAPNVSAAPRIMWTHRFLTEETHGDMAALMARARARYGASGGDGASAAAC